MADEDKLTWESLNEGDVITRADGKIFMAYAAGGHMHLTEGKDSYSVINFDLEAVDVRKMTAEEINALPDEIVQSVMISAINLKEQSLNETEKVQLLRFRALMEQTQQKGGIEKVLADIENEPGLLMLSDLAALGPQHNLLQIMTMAGDITEDDLEHFLADSSKFPEANKDQFADNMRQQFKKIHEEMPYLTDMNDMFDLIEKNDKSRFPEILEIIKRNPKFLIINNGGFLTLLVNSGMTREQLDDILGTEESLAAKLTADIDAKQFRQDAVNAFEHLTAADPDAPPPVVEIDDPVPAGGGLTLTAGTADAEDVEEIDETHVEPLNVEPVPLENAIAGSLAEWQEKNTRRSVHSMLQKDQFGKTQRKPFVDVELPLDLSAVINNPVQKEAFYKSLAANLGVALDNIYVDILRDPNDQNNVVTRVCVNDFKFSQAGLFENKIAPIQLDLHAALTAADAADAGVDAELISQVQGGVIKVEGNHTNIAWNVNDYEKPLLAKAFPHIYAQGFNRVDVIGDRLGRHLVDNVEIMTNTDGDDTSKHYNYLRWQTFEGYDETGKPKNPAIVTAKPDSFHFDKGITPSIEQSVEWALGKQGQRGWDNFKINSANEEDFLKTYGAFVAAGLKVDTDTQQRYDAMVLDQPDKKKIATDATAAFAQSTFIRSTKQGLGLAA